MEPLYLHHYPATYTITFVPNDSNAAFPGRSNAGKSDISLGDAIDQAGVNSGYKVGETTAIVNGQLCVFAGWYDNPAFLGNPADFGKMPDRDLTFYAKWTPVSYQVHFHPMINGNVNDVPDANKFAIDANGKVK